MSKSLKECIIALWVILEIREGSPDEKGNGFDGIIVVIDCVY
jgi:hypothetical protein